MMYTANEARQVTDAFITNEEAKRQERARIYAENCSNGKIYEAAKEGKSSVTLTKVPVDIIGLIINELVKAKYRVVRAQGDSATIRVEW